jgi:glycosyltransferase involved in cell wall biosynthesis
MNPLISICVPTYNGAKYLRECLDSALAQTFQDFELLIVDDFSIDATPAIAKEYFERDCRVKFFRNRRNLGLVPNWNRCLDLAKGQWIKFLFQDDRLAPSCLSQMLHAVKPNVDLVVTRRELLFEEGTTDEVKETYKQHLSKHDLSRHFPGECFIPPEEMARILISMPGGNCIGEPTATMVRRSAFAEYGYFNRHLVLLCDWECFARISVNTGLCYLNEPFAYFRVHNNAESARIRFEGNYRGSTIDPLIIQHELIFSSHYSTVRAVAGRLNPPVDLQKWLTDSVKRARWEAISMNDSRKAMAEWWKALGSHPRLLSCVVRALLQKFGSRQSA